jgi:energy-coupling factor transporter ATP-binding protein EcfA2
MTDEEAIAQLVQTVRKFNFGKPLKHYITHAVFPRFKGIEPGTRVDFAFPLTALVGANGIGKSSLLHALWGMPHGYSTHKFWFATALDPINSQRGAPQRYFYGHWNESFDGIVETRKARIGKKADYWEPYRLSTADGMQPLPDGEFEGKDKDRWNPVKRKVVYVNLKATFGSFDRFFYFEDFDKNDELRRVMQLEAMRLKRIKESNRQAFKLGGVERLFLNRDLTSDELLQVCRILGRTYESARLIKHSLYPGARGRDTSVVFKRGAEYSEAFAGSGEIAAVRVVVDVLAAEEHSLILLDEPETSLHPGAQRALLRFLLEQIKLKKHQVILSTHSSEFLNGLPDNAIKVFEDNGKMQTRVLPQSSPAAALIRLGKVPQDKIRILVEDQLGELLVAHAAKGLDAGDVSRLETKVSPGGGDFMLKYSGPAMMEAAQPVFMLLDGDKRKVVAFTDPATIPVAEEAKLGEILHAELGLEPLLAIPGGHNDAAHQRAKIDAQRNYLNWLRGHVEFFPKRLPEQVILEALDPGKGHAETASAAAKAAFILLLTDGVDVGVASASDILAWARLKVAKIPAHNDDISAIRDVLKLWLGGPAGAA